MVVYLGQSGIRYQTLNSIGSGGEGKVFSLASPHDDKVLKVYNVNRRPRNKESIDKLLALSKFHPKNPSFFNNVAWIKDIIYDKNEISAIVLQKAVGKELYFVSPDKTITWEERLNIAKNFCGIVYFFHSENQVIGDFNAHNFLIDLNTHFIKMVDVDSIHFKDEDGRIYRCNVLDSDIAPPELLGVDCGKAPLPTFTKQSDLWCLAIHVFKILMCDFHPFVAKVSNQSGSRATNKSSRVRDGKTPFFKKEKGEDVPANAPEIDWVFPTTTIDLFKRTFLDGHSDPYKRVGAKEWFDELNKLSKNIKTCKLNKSHIYYRGKKSCPWCKLDIKTTKNTKSTIKTMGNNTSVTTIKNTNSTIKTMGNNISVTTTHPTHSFSSGSVRPALTVSQQLPQLQKYELFTFEKLRTWIIITGLVSVFFGGVYSLKLTEALSLNNLIVYSVRLFFPYLLVGGGLWIRDQLISYRVTSRAFLINITFVIAIIFMRAAILTPNGDVSPYYYWDNIPWMLFAWSLATGVNRLITLAISKIPNYPNADTRQTIMDNFSLIIMTIGTLAAGVEYMVYSTGEAFWGRGYIHSVPPWLHFIEDLFFIKLFSIENSSIFFTIATIITIILVFIPDYSSKIPRWAKLGLPIVGIILGYLLISSYLMAVLSMIYLLGILALIFFIVWAIVVSIMG